MLIASIALMGAIALSEPHPVPPMASAPKRSIRYLSFERGGAYYHCVVADMASGNVTAEVVMKSGLTPVWELIAVNQPAAAITGTFFAWESHDPVADVLIDGELQATGAIGSVVAFDWYGEAHMFDSKHNQPVDWFPYRHALRGAVRIVSDGKVDPNPRAQSFTDSSIWGHAARTGVGLEPNGKLILMATPHAVTLSELGGAMLSLGVTEAVSLDGGGSTMLYYRGEMVISPGRQLSNILVLHERPPVPE